MEYQEQIVERIKDSDKWPSFDRPEFLGELDELAAEAISKKTIEGYLAALLIYQQLVEEMLKVFIENHEFFLQLSVFPAEIKLRKRAKSQFGRLIEDLKDTVTLDNQKEKIIELANKLNKIRINLVHGLTKITNINEIKTKVEEAKNIYEEFYEIFDYEHDMFRVTY